MLWMISNRKRPRPGCAARQELGAQGPPHVTHDLVKRLTIDVLHAVVVHRALAAHRVNGHDVSMVQLSRRPRFVVESGDLAFVQHRREGQNLQCHAPTQRDLRGLVDNAHPTPAHLTQQSIVA